MDSFCPSSSFSTRDLLIDYTDKDEFSDTIKKAKARVEAFNEQRLFGNNVTGVIFNLKNNFGWKDKTEVDQNMSGALEMGVSERPKLSKKEWLKVHGVS